MPQQTKKDQRRINYVEDASSEEEESEPEEIRQITHINQRRINYVEDASSEEEES